MGQNKLLADGYEWGRARLVLTMYDCRQDMELMLNINKNTDSEELYTRFSRQCLLYCPGVHCLYGIYQLCKSDFLKMLWNFPNLTQKVSCSISTETSLILRKKSVAVFPLKSKSVKKITSVCHVFKKGAWKLKRIKHFPETRSDTRRQVRDPSPRLLISPFLKLTHM